MIDPSLDPADVAGALDDVCTTLQSAYDQKQGAWTRQMAFVISDGIMRASNMRYLTDLPEGADTPEQTRFYVTQNNRHFLCVTHDLRDNTVKVRTEQDARALGDAELLKQIGFLVQRYNLMPG